MKTKLAGLKALMMAGDHGPALKLAASFPRLGDHKAAIQQGWAAWSAPSFYRELGKDPDTLVRAGLTAILERYGWQDEIDLKPVVK